MKLVYIDWRQKIMYGIWNSMEKKFQFGIREISKSKAQRKLFEKIGYDSYKWRFDVRRIPEK